jgi:WD40 repeat protein
VRIVDVATGATTALPGHTALARSPVFTPDGEKVVTASDDSTARVWHSDGTPVAVFTGHHGSVVRLDMVGTDRIASIGQDGRLLLWPIDASGYTELFRAPTPLIFVRTLSTTREIVVSDARGAVSAVTFDGRARTIRLAGSAVTNLRASRDGARLAISSDDGEVTVYDTAGWTAIARHRATAAVQSVQFDRDAHTVVFTTADGHVRVLALDGANPFGWDDVPLRTRIALLSPDGRTLALAVGGGGTWLYAADERRWTYVQDHQSEVTAIVFSPDGRWFVSCDSRGVVTLRDIEATRNSQRE